MCPGRTRCQAPFKDFVDAPGTPIVKYSVDHTKSVCPGSSGALSLRSRGVGAFGPDPLQTGRSSAGAGRRPNLPMCLRGRSYRESPCGAAASVQSDWCLRVNRTRTMTLPNTLNTDAKSPPPTYPRAIATFDPGDARRSHYGRVQSQPHSCPHPGRSQSSSRVRFRIWKHSSGHWRPSATQPAPVPAGLCCSQKLFLSRTPLDTDHVDQTAQLSQPEVFQRLHHC